MTLFFVIQQELYCFALRGKFKLGYHCTESSMEITTKMYLEVTSYYYYYYYIPGLIREYDSTLYVGLARAVSPTNTNFRLTFLLTRLQEALYEDLAV